MKRRGSVIFFVIGIVAVVAAIGFVLILRHRRVAADSAERDHRRRELAKGPEVPVVVAKLAPPTRHVELPGEVRAMRLATVYARVSGYLSELYVDRGDRVTDNQLLGKVTTPETDRQLAPLILNLNTKRAIADRLRPLVPKGVIAQQDLDRADADVQAAQSDVDRLRAVRGFNELRAPFAGVITNRYVDIGALMPAPTGTTQSAQPLVDIADTRSVRIVAYLGQRDAVAVHVGDSIIVVRDNDPLHPVAASVTRIPQELEPRTRTMWVESDLDNTAGAFYPGVFVTVALEIPAPVGVMIPSEAITLVAGKPVVALVRDGHARFVAIEVADDDGKTARVIRGLVIGDVIATRVSDEIVDGGVVRPVTPKQLEPGGGSGSASGSGNGSGGGNGSGSGGRTVASGGQS